MVKHAKTPKILNDGQIRFILPESERQQLTDICDRNDTTVSIQLRKFIRQYIEDNK